MISVRLLLLLLIWYLHPAFAESLEFRHGVSQIPNYELKYGPDFKNFDYVNINAPKGGSIKMPYTWRFNSVSPIAKPYGYDFSYDKLLERSADEISGYYCSLCESVAVSNDGLKIIFRMRAEARWHDNQPINAEDVKFSLDTFREDFRSSWSDTLRWIESIEVTDALTVTIYTNTDASKQVPLLQGVPIIPEHYWRERDLHASSMEPPLQSGPYRLTSAGRGKSFVYERIPDYWGSNLPINRGLYNFDDIQFDYYLDGTVAREALRAGEFDVWTENDLRHWVSSYEIPALEKGWLLKGKLASGALAGSTYRLVFNTKRKPFSNLKVRAAMSYIYDYNWQNRTLHNGENKRANSYFANSPFAARGLPTEAETIILEQFKGQVPDEVFDRKFFFHESTGFGIDRGGLTIAIELLNQAGYEIENQILVDESGETLKIEFLIAEEDKKRTLIPFMRTLNLLGAQASIRLIDQAGYASLVKDGSFDVIVNPGWIEVPPSWQLRINFHSSASHFNPGGINDPVVDALVESSLNASDIDDFQSSVRALDRVLLWNFYQMPLSARGADRIIYWNKFGRPELSSEVLLEPYPHSWWYDEDKATQITNR